MNEAQLDQLNDILNKVLLDVSHQDRRVNEMRNLKVKDIKKVQSALQVQDSFKDQNAELTIR